MTATPLYIQPQEFEDRIGPENMLAIFDDAGTRTLNTDAVNTVLLAASRLVTGCVAPEYRGTLPFPVGQIPELATELTYRFAITEIAIRNPDWANAWMKSQGFTLKDWRDWASDLEKQMNNALMRMIDAEAPRPANVGGSLSSVIGDPNFPGGPTIVFSNMGDF